MNSHDITYQLTKSALHIQKIYKDAPYNKERYTFPIRHITTVKLIVEIQSEYKISCVKLFLFVNERLHTFESEFTIINTENLKWDEILNTKTITLKNGEQYALPITKEMIKKGYHVICDEKTGDIMECKKLYDLYYELNEMLLGYIK